MDKFREALERVNEKLRESESRLERVMDELRAERERRSRLIEELEIVSRNESDDGDGWMRPI
jgi:hypothetical protein